MDNENGNERQEDVYSKSVRAGKRTYFFDIKATKGNDFYLTLTESKKSIVNGRDNFEKHKIFLYKEDFDKFLEGLESVIQKARSLHQEHQSKSTAPSLTDISFEEL